MKAPPYTGVLLCLSVAVLQACNRGPVSKPDVVGSERFKDQVHGAIVLLQQHDLSAYEVLTNNVGRIEEARRSGMRAYDTPPVYEMSDKTAFYSVTWCAATIAHDSFHSKLYHDYQRANPGRVPDSVWTGQAAERKCMEHQLGVMRNIGASAWEISYAASQADGHYVTNALNWAEYRKRWW